MSDKSILTKIFEKNKSVGIVGNSNSAKSSFVLCELLKVKKEVDIPIYVLGIEKSISEYVQNQGVNVLHSSEDLLDLKIRNSLIYIDEFAELFDVKMSSKQSMKIKRFFNRLFHLNNFVIVCSAEINFWNKFMCSLIDVFVVKKVSFNNLVRGTDLKRKIMSIKSNFSDYFLDIGKKDFFVISEDLVFKSCFEYDVFLDSKRFNVNPFVSGSSLSVETSIEKSIETKLETKFETKLETKIEKQKED